MSINSKKKKSLIKTKKRIRYGGTKQKKQPNKTQPNKTNRFIYKASFYKPSEETSKEFKLPPDTTKPSKETSKKIIMPPDTTKFKLPPDTTKFKLPPNTTKFKLPPDTTKFKLPPDTTNIKVADVTEHDTDAVHGLLSISMPRDTTKFSGGVANDRKYSRRQRLFNGRRKIKSGIKTGGVEKKSL